MVSTQEVKIQFNQNCAEFFSVNIFGFLGRCSEPSSVNLFYANIVLGVVFFICSPKGILGQCKDFEISFVYVFFYDSGILWSKL